MTTAADMANVTARQQFHVQPIAMQPYTTGQDFALPATETQSKLISEIDSNSAINSPGRAKIVSLMNAESNPNLHEAYETAPTEPQIHA